ncbi:MAG: general secretion pathway protein G [Desulfobacteraceae bacterium Eth-SRB2]|nr:MAG: general secretion pathway protein G [Desulfobacteraceae bacterium Eth-SRB2]
MCYYPLYYGHGSRKLQCSDNGIQKVSRRGFTLIEIMIVVAIIGTLSAMVVPNYLKYKEMGKIAVAITDVRIIEKQINIYAIDTGELPDSLNDLSISNTIDPWNNPYQYIRIDGGNAPQGQLRKDHFLVPVNTDYDLYSMGKDGKSTATFTAKASQDDIVRVNNGGFVGLVSDY